MASTLRRRICMTVLPFHLVRSADPIGPALHTVRFGPGCSRRMD